MLELNSYPQFIGNNIFKNINCLLIILYIYIYKFKVIFLLFKKFKKKTKIKFLEKNKIKYKKFIAKLLVLNLPLLRNIKKYKKNIKKIKLIQKTFNNLKLNFFKKNSSKYYAANSNRLVLYLYFHTRVFRYNTLKKFTRKKYLYKGFVSFKKKKDL